ncbi:histidine phosphatase superfamily [Fennellomyces sp. T-0311]|nr:histidine phosphatase superfamily [Fennellomyces sp. T-0311]
MHIVLIGVMTQYSFRLSRQWLAAVFLLASTRLAVAQRFTHDINWISRHLGNITPYLPLGSIQDLQVPPGYSLEQIQIIVRHGSRYPADTDIEHIANAVSIVQKSTSPTDSWITGYDNVYTMERNFELDRNGQIQLYQLGRRLTKAIPYFIEAMIDNDIIRNFSAISTSSKRVTQSAHAFEVGLLEGYGPLPGQLNAAPLITLPENQNFLVGSSVSCKQWYYNVYMPEQATTSQPNLYLEAAARPIANRLSRELGISNLTPVDVYDIYLACAFDVSHRGWTKTFCSLLSPQDILALEYYMDLKEYYLFSYGSTLNGFSCYLVEDIMENIEQVVSGIDFNRTVIKAAHEDTIVNLETFLDLFKDEPILASDSSPLIIENRHFRSSITTSFASNFMFQVLRTIDDPSSYSIRVLFAEKPITLPGCPDEICPLPIFKSIIRPKLNCNDIESKCRRT